MYRLFLVNCLVFVFGFCSFSFADTQKITLNGDFDFTVVSRFQKDIDAENKKMSANQKRNAFNTAASLALNFKNVSENDVEYGAFLATGLTSMHNTFSNVNGSHIFISHDDFGKVEVGSPHVAAAKMSVGAENVSLETFKWDDYAVLSPKSDYEVEYKTYRLYDYRTDTASGKKEPARCVSYYTPKYSSGIQLGMSFLPDVSNTGGKKFSDFDNKDDEQSFVLSDGSVYKTKLSLVNALSVAATYDQEMSDSFSFKIGLSSELAKAAQKDTDGNVLSHKKKIRNLRTYTLGGIVSYDQVSIGLTYSDFGKSLMSKSEEVARKSRSKTNYYGIATSYTQGPWGVSLACYNTDNRKNTLKYYSLAGNYSLAPGLSNYFEVAKYIGKGYSYKSANQIDYKVKSDGVVGMMGLRLHF